MWLPINVGLADRRAVCNQDLLALEVARQATTFDFVMHRNTVTGTLGFTLDGLRVRSVEPESEAARVSLPIGHYVIKVNSSSVVSRGGKGVRGARRGEGWHRPLGCMPFHHRPSFLIIVHLLRPMPKLISNPGWRCLGCAVPALRAVDQTPPSHSVGGRASKEGCRSPPQGQPPPGAHHGAAPLHLSVQRTRGRGLKARGAGMTASLC